MSLQRTVTAKVLNTVTGAVLSGYTLYVDGAVSGSDALVAAGLTHNFEVKLAGFQGSVKTTLVPSGSGSFTVTLPMTPVSPNVAVRVQFYPAVSGIPFTLVNHELEVDPINGTSYSGGLAEVAQVTPGSYTLAVVDPNYESKSQDLEVTADKRSFVVSLIRKAPGGAQNSPIGPQIDDSGIAANPEDLVIADDVSEDTYDNSAYLQYFTSSQARLYIGNLFIDEMNTIQWGMQQNNVPIFGYCSEFMDAIGRGRSIVQGQLVLNYVHQGYLYAALHNYDKAASSAQPPANASTLSKLIRASAAGSAPALQTAIDSRLSDVAQASSPDDVRQAKQLLRQAKSVDPYAANPVYRHTLFDMRLEIGDGPYKTIRMLENCKLGVNEVLVHAQSGEPLAESYTFTARRAR